MLPTQFLSQVSLNRDTIDSFDRYPFNLPSVRHLDQLNIDARLTVFVGENGSGKSTLLEAMAVSLGFNPEGGSRNFGFRTRESHSPLHRHLRLVKGYRQPRDGFFLRAESFFNVASFVDSEGIFAPDLSLYGGVPLHQQSHGQAFLALAANRFGGESLYVLDEPEAALSVSGALALVAIVVRAAAVGAQFVIATHSPILLATPGARIYELDERGIAACAYDDLDTVRLMRGFLDAPERYLRAALGE
jgi:predicted ATPase